MCCDSCAHSDSEACQTSSEEEDSQTPDGDQTLSAVFIMPMCLTRRQCLRISCVCLCYWERNHLRERPRGKCVRLLCADGRKESGVEQRVAQANRWQVIKTLKHEALWLCVVVCVVRECKSYLIYCVCLRWWFFVLCHLLYLCDSQYDNLPPSGD